MRIWMGFDRASVEDLLAGQLKNWQLAADNYKALEHVKVKHIDLDGWDVKVQYNPARIVSTGAKVDSATIKERPCFLCNENRPKDQRGIPTRGCYTVLVNPFPIFPRHFTIPANSHVPQEIRGRVVDMVALAATMDGYTVFYNGPKCGASAPDHQHFQAGNSDFLTIWDALDSAHLEVVGKFSASTIYMSHDFPLNCFVIESEEPGDCGLLFDYICSALAYDDPEPAVNILCRVDDGHIRMIVIPRKRHRPSFYGTGVGQMLISPASVDLGGVIITPREEDFHRIDADTIRSILDDTVLSKRQMRLVAVEVKERLRDEPVVKVGVMASSRIDFQLDGVYVGPDGNLVSGPMSVDMSADGQGILSDGVRYERIKFAPVNDDCTFELKNVTIGVNFHWERKENQRFRGALSFIISDGKLTAVNEIGIEEYLVSVISSEMSANASLELLKAHAVISRSWVLKQVDNRRKQESVTHIADRPGEHIQWYDHDDHADFDVCADDHCQRYQGITRATTPKVREAVEATRAMVLTYGDDEHYDICDARFSKCCGGVFEEFENCWEPVHHSYLEARRDSDNENDYPDLTIEENAEKWILSRPEAFCNTDDNAVLSQVLNNYDRETADFYRWRVEYTREELATLVKSRSGIDFGVIKDLVPIERGTSGRLVRLKIVGTKLSLVIGKELEIRKFLSPSHLYSSAFVVERINIDADGVPERIVLHGAGWGHGVGLCQIGAAVMGAKGYDWKAILLHYFVNAEIRTFYWHEQH